MSLQFLTGQSLSEYTTLQIGGVARSLVKVETEEELEDALQFAKQTAAHLLVLGEGSNVLCRDEGFEGLVIINKIKNYTVEHSEDGTVSLTVGAGENLDAVISRTVEENIWGLENLSSIPGSVGATPVQNVGAYGVEVSELITSVAAINIISGEKKMFSHQDCNFSYRDSFFKTPVGKEWCVIAVTFQLNKNPKPILHYKDLQVLRDVEGVTQLDIRNHVIDVRAKKFPDWKKVGTAGSFFKNPIIENNAYKELKLVYPDLPGHQTEDKRVKVSLGWILDKVCNLKGYSQENVGLYKEQALVLVADRNATAADVSAFVSDIQSKVRSKTGIQIEREVLTV